MTNFDTGTTDKEVELNHDGDPATPNSLSTQQEVPKTKKQLKMFRTGAELKLRLAPVLRVRVLFAFTASDLQRSWVSALCSGQWCVLACSKTKLQTKTNSPKPSKILKTLACRAGRGGGQFSSQGLSIAEVLGI